MGGVGIDRSQHTPHIFVINHLDNFVAGSAPEGGIVVHHQLEGFAAVAARGVGLVDGHGCAVEHHAAEGLVAVILNGAQESDAHFGEVLEVGDGHVARGTVVFHGLGVVLVVWLGEARVGAQIVGRVGVRRQRARLRPAGRIRAAGAGAGRLRQGGCGKQEHG